jgi:hypothetical protein
MIEEPLMSKIPFRAQLVHIFANRKRAGLAHRRGSKVRRLPGVESLERRALLASITASAVINAARDDANYDYTIRLSNSGSSSAAVGTFWYAWIPVPNEDFLATRPISVTPPAGWTDSLTNSGASDGWGILFTAASSASYVQPGRSLNFQFKSVDKPASVNGNSIFHSGTPVGTSVVYPTIAFSDGGHQFVVTPGSTSNLPPPVTVISVQPAFNKKHLVSEIVVKLSGAVSATEAQETGIYRLITASKHGSFTAKNAGTIKLRSAAYQAASDTITLKPNTPFSLAKPTELIINGTPPSGLRDTFGRLIDGDHNGKPGGNATAVLR